MNTKTKVNIYLFNIKLLKKTLFTSMIRVILDQKNYGESLTLKYIFLY